MILSIGISIENMFIRFRAKLRHYALIITKFNHTCMVYIADRALKHCTLYMHADVLTRAHFVLLLQFVLYILYTFYVPISLSLIDCSLLRLTNRTSSCYKVGLREYSVIDSPIVQRQSNHTSLYCRNSNLLCCLTQTKNKTKPAIRHFIKNK